MYLKVFIPLIWLYCFSLSLLANESILDLRERDWSVGQVHSLQGSWDFYWQQLISPEQFGANQSQANSFPVPGAWNSPPKGIQSFPGFGYATYKTSILVPINKTDIYLAIPDMASAYKLWSNGKVVAENGVIGTSKDTETPAYLPKFVFLTPNEGELELVLQTSNYHYQWGGVWYPLQLTDAEGIYKLREMPIIRSMLSATVLIAASLFGLFMFFSRPKEKVLLYFSLLCLAMGLRRLLIDERVIYFFFGEHWSLLQALENLCTYLAFPFFISYFSYKFPVKFSRKAIQLSWLMVVPFCFLALTSDVSFYTRFNVPFQVMILLSLPYIFYIYIKCLREGRRGAKTFGFGLGIFILAVLNDILTYSYVIHTPNLSHLGILTFVIFQGIDLAKSYLHNFAKIEEMSNSLQSKNQELMKIDAFKNEFLATTSHELRTPLHGISGLASHLLNDPSLNLKPEHQHKLDLISSTTRRLGSLVNDIVDFASIKHGNIKLNIKCIDLNALSNSVVSTLKPLVSGRDIRLTYSISKEAQFVLADENRLQQILFNLLGNAIKFTEAGIIQLNARTLEKPAKSLLKNEDKDYVTIEIIDTGIGIASDKYDLLFEPFHHFGEPSDSLYSGSGLGLSISRQLVRLHGGDLQIKSQESLGTTVTFSLPALDPNSDVAVQHKSTNTKPASQVKAFTLDELDSDQHTHNLITRGSWLKQNTTPDSIEGGISTATKHQLASDSVENSLIFVVDDEEVNLELVHAQLSSIGYITECFSCGNAVLERLTKQRPDLILLDLMMPTINGLDVCRMIRERFDSYELPIMMLTARYQVSDIVDCLNAGANDYLIKPYHEKELLARVYSQLSARKFWISHQENQTLKKEVDHRKQLEDELSLANSRLLHALDITDECILLLSDEFEIIYANQPALIFLKTQNEVLLGNPLSDIISVESKAQLNDFLAKAQSSNTASTLSLATKDTHLGKVECVVHPFQEKSEQYFALIIYQNSAIKETDNDKKLTKELIKTLTEELATSRNKFGQIEQALKQISTISQQTTINPPDTKQIETDPDNQYRRDLLVKLLRETISTWEHYTHKAKADLAEESRCWRVYLDGTTAKTRTLDRYLSERTLPIKPRWQLVIRTAKHVLENCELKAEDSEKLTEMMTALDKAFE
jgi:signal transduction histidine kinase/DNA-binding response OmpR family regulator